jgi:hypothetical protein
MYLLDIQESKYFNYFTSFYQPSFFLSIIQHQVLFRLFQFMKFGISFEDYDRQKVIISYRKNKNIQVYELTKIG